MAEQLPEYCEGHWGSKSKGANANMHKHLYTRWWPRNESPRCARHFTKPSRRLLEGTTSWLQKFQRMFLKKFLRDVLAWIWGWWYADVVLFFWNLLRICFQAKRKYTVCDQILDRSGRISDCCSLWWTLCLHLDTARRWFSNSLLSTDQLMTLELQKIEWQGFFTLIGHPTSYCIYEYDIPYIYIQTHILYTNISRNIQFFHEFFNCLSTA